MPGIIVTLLLIYIFWRLIVGSSSESREAAQEELVQDPVCGLYLPESEALKVRKDGVLLHFCSEKCKTTFFLEKEKGSHTEENP